MKTARILGPMVLVGVVGCTDAPLDPNGHVAPAPNAHVGAPASSCTLAPLPATAHVIACFTTTLQPGVWHGWALEVATAQPPGIDGNFSRTRLNHQYLLASPQGFRQLGPSDGIVPPIPFENASAFQAEFNGTFWSDVLRLHAAANGPSQTVPVVVYWLEPADAAGELTAAVATLLNGGVVNGGQANALTRKISQALNLIAKGKTADAIVVLQDFIQQLYDLTSNGVLSPAQSQPLVAWAHYIISGIGGGGPPAGPFAGAWSGTYDFGPMSAVLQQNGSAVTGTITDAAACIWGVTGTASGISLPLPNWVLQSGAGVCVGGSASMTGSLDASGNTWSGTGLTTLAGGAQFPWSFALSRVSP